MNESKKIKSNEHKWDNWALAADGDGWKYEYLRKGQDRVIEMAQIKQNVNFLDIGCGTGRAVWLAAKRANFRGDFYGVDISERMIEKSGQNFSDHDNLHFIKASSESIPIKDNYFDIIICTNSFHHYLHPEMAMSEISRLLKQGGKIFILDPVADNWISILIDQMFRLFETSHVKFYSSSEFRDLMHESGLQYTGVNSLNKMHKVQIGEK